MDRAKDDRCARLKKAFARARTGMSGPGAGIRYSKILKQMAVDAVTAGIPASDVVAAAGIAGTTLTGWLKSVKRAGKAKPGGSTKTRDSRFRRLKVVGDSTPTAAAVSMVVGKGMRLEIPPELLTADLLRRLTEASS